MDRHDLAFLVEGIISFILIVVLSLFLSSQSANAKWLSKEEMDNLFKNGDVLVARPFDQKINGVIYKQLEVWYRLNGKIHYCISGMSDPSKIYTTCHDDSPKNE